MDVTTSTATNVRHKNGFPMALPSEHSYVVTLPGLVPSRRLYSEMADSGYAVAIVAPGQGRRRAQPQPDRAEPEHETVFGAHGTSPFEPRPARENLPESVFKAAGSALCCGPSPGW